ncbi:MAG: exosortase-associated EpsI family protein [Phycisphaerae bacterium]|nr:exosortase-associated EpsI family protein [Phycisphaerae bacterium]
MRFDRTITLAFVAACAILFLGALGFAGAVRQLNYFLMKEPIELRAALDTLPTRIGEFERAGNDRHFSKEILEELGTNQYVDRTYVRKGQVGPMRVDVHIAYYTGTIDDVPHIPERCSVVHGNQLFGDTVEIPLKLDTSAWNMKSGVFNRATGLEYASTEVADPITLRRTTVHLPVEDLILRVSEFQSPSRPRWRQIAGYLFIANGRTTPNAYGVRRLAFSRTERFAYYCKIQLSVEGMVPGPDDSLMPTFIENANEIVSAILPPLMARLPDWPAVEAGKLDVPPAAPARTTP